MGRSSAAFASVALLVLATACRPADSGSSGGGKAAQDVSQSGAPAQAVIAASVDQLSVLQLAAPLHWSFAQGVGAAPALEVNRSQSGNALALTTTSDTGAHRVGVEGSFGEGPKTLRIAVWVKGAPGTDVMLEASGRTKSGAAPVDHRVTYFDLAKGEVQANPLVTDATRFPAAAIATDGEWRRLTADFPTRDGSLKLVIGATSQGQNVFAGSPAHGIVVGGVEVQPG